MTTSGTVTVYKLVNKINGKFYIGITSRSVASRMSGHRGDARRGHKTKIANAIRKCGWEAFCVEVLLSCQSWDEATKEEIALIAKLKPEYNITIGGDGVIGVVGYWKGKKRSKQDREKMRLGRLDNPTRYWLGKKRSLETIEKIKLSKKGCAAPPITELMSKTRAENCRMAAAKRRKPVICLNTGEVYRSVAAAAALLKIDKSNLSACCKGKRLSMNGLRFAFTENVCGT